MKLLIATDNHLPRWDGVARFLAELVPRLRGTDITILSPDYGESALDGHARRVRVPLAARQYGDYTPAQWRPRIVKAAVKEADAVFVQTIGPVGALAHRYARRYRKPVVAYTHSLEWDLVPRALGARWLTRILQPVAKLLARRYYNRADLLLVPSKDTAEKLTYHGIRTKKRVVHLGVDTKRFAPGDRTAARQRLGLPQDAFIVGFHGRLGWEKNLLTLTRGYVRLKGEKRLLLVGAGTPALIRKLKKVGGTVLPGPQEDVVPWLQAMDAYVMPSYTETTSLATLEAMSCALPVVASKVGYIEHYLEDGRNGYFFDNRNAFQLSTKLQLLAEDAVLRERVGHEARKMVVHHFDWEKTAREVQEALSSVSSSSKRRKRRE